VLTFLCDSMATQVIPPGDPTCLELAVQFREELVKEMGKGGSGKGKL
jgi:hypothetical protein